MPIFGPKKDELIGEFRRLDYAELCELYSVNIVEVISSRRSKWACKIVELGNERIPKRLIFAVRNGKRPRDRPETAQKTYGMVRIDIRYSEGCTSQKRPLNAWAVTTKWNRAKEANGTTTSGITTSRPTSSSRGRTTGR
ncbi:unnamed protein product [Nezara viridula]|uniref:Uncharacterized protein n=1 Tax=Nezara viridula TaxID=85310 RepID=A0A9P0H5F4_NEZVI|nr:unnamed protein product [Nezara viridula]